MPGKSKKRVRFAPEPPKHTASRVTSSPALTDAMMWGTRRRALVAFLIATAVAAIGFTVWYKRNNVSSTKEAASGINPNTNPINGLNIQKQAQCANDENCPDGYICNSSGYCVPNEMEPRVKLNSILGRGRGGEGANVQRVSDEERGQE